MTRSTTRKRATSPHQKRRAIASKAGAVLAWALLWFLAARAVNKPLLVASPGETLRELLSLAGDPAFYQTVLRSLASILGGFFSAVAAGCLVACLSLKSTFLRAFFAVPLGVVKATPVASFIILALVWLKSSHLSLFISFLMVLPLVAGNVYQGLVETDGKLLEMGRTFGFGRVGLWRHVYLPSAMPYFLAACKTGLGMAWKAGVAAEVLGMVSGTIGRQLYDAKIYLETPKLFAWTAVVILLSVGMERLFSWLVERLGAHWRKREGR